MSNLSVPDDGVCAAYVAVNYGPGECKKHEGFHYHCKSK